MCDVLQRWQHAAVVHEGSIFILGGWGMVMLDDVWKTSDGVNWIKVHTLHTHKFRQRKIIKNETWRRQDPYIRLL